MASGASFSDNFDTFDQTFWLVSDFAIDANFIDAAWSPTNVIEQPGSVSLELNTDDLLGKNFTGAEIKTAQDYWYGVYDVTMQITDEPGVLTSFFMFTGEFFGDPRSEIDIEFRSNDPTKVDFTIHTPDGSSGVIVDLGFDASAAEHTYSFEWTQDSVSWYADNVLLHTITAAEFTIPEHQGAIFASIWTGSNSFTGTPTFTDSTSSNYSAVSFTAGADTTADANGNLMLTSDSGLVIDASDVRTALFTLSGLDGDASAVVSVSDGVDTVTQVFTENTTLFLNLSGLLDGALTTSVTATDGSGNVAVVTGPGLTLDTSTGLNVVVQTSATILGTGEADLIDASDTAFAVNNVIRADGGNDVVLANAGNDDVRGGNGSDQLSGGDGNDKLFGQNGLDLLIGGAGRDIINGGNDNDTLQGDAGDDILRGDGGADTFAYAAAVGVDLGDDRLDDFDAAEGDSVTNTGDAGAVLIVSVNGAGKLTGSVRASGADLAAAMAAPELGTVLFNDTSFAQTATVSDLSAYFNADADPDLEGLSGWSAVFFDGVDETPDVSADEDGNLTLSAPDTVIDANEMTAVSLTVSGIDADADAIVTVTDSSGASVSGALASDGAVVLDLSSLVDGALTTNVTATDTNANVASAAGPGLSLDKTPVPDLSADQDGNLMLSAPDTDIDVTEVTAVSMTVSGLDADADAVVTVTDSGGASVSGALASDGAVVLDLSSLADGALTTNVTATDTSANTATVAGPALNLDTITPPDTSADEDGNLTLSAPDTDIDATEVTAVSMTISGLDADADAVITVTDSGGASATGVLADDGAVFLNLSGLLDGALTTSVTATDGSGNVAVVTGPGLTLDTSTGLNVVVQTSATILGTGEADLIDASDTAFAVNNVIRADGGNDVVLANAGNDDVRGGNGSDQLSGGDGNDKLFGQNGLDLLIGGAGRDIINGGNDNDTLQGDAGDDILRGDGGADTFAYAAAVGVDLGDDRLDDFDAAEGDSVTNTGDAGAVLIVSVNGAGKLTGSVRASGADLAAAMAAPELGTVLFNDTSFAQTATVSDLSAYFNADADPDLEGLSGWSAVFFDGVDETPDVSADEDGNLTLSAPDTVIDANEMTAVSLTVSGIDADADAIVTVTDSSGASVSGALASDGAVVLDLSSLVDGALTTNVTATDTNANVASAAGPGLSLDKTPVPDLSADQDGNLMLSAPDTDIDVTEVTAVSMTVSGLDADADAVVTVTDSGGASVSGALASDGAVVLDLSSLADGALTTNVTATDTSANTATVAGPALNLDTITPPDTSADEDGNLTLSAPDTDIDATEVTAVSMTISGLDADADAVITVTDSGGASATGVLADDGAVFLNLSGLLDGALTTSVTATDGSGNVAVVTGPGLTLDTSTGLNVVVQTSATILGTGEADLIDASDTAFAVNNVIRADGGNDVVLANAGNDDVRGGNGSDQLSGGDGNDKLFGQNGLDLLIGGAGRDIINGGNDNDTLQGDAGDDILRGDGGADTFAYAAAVGVDLGDDRLDDFDAAEGDSVTNTGDAGAVLIVSVNGAGKLTGSVRASGADLAAAMAAPELGTVLFNDTSFAQTATVSDLSAYFNADADPDLEGLSGWSAVFFDGVDETPDVSADEDGNLTLSAPDTVIDANEMTAVSLTVSGIDADADAIVTVTDSSGASVSGALASDGAVVLDLSSLVDGALTTNVTATDTNANVASAAGPGLSLDKTPVPDLSADQDGNLMLSAPDTDIDVTEVTAVSMTVSGLDADADAVVTVTDSGGASVSGALASDGAVVLDLSSLADGALTTNVTATDTSANTATVAGPALNLDTTALALSFTGETRALSIDLAARTYAFAAKVLSLGDSLTHGFLGGLDPETLESRDLQAGFRDDLFEGLLAHGALIDYVGAFQSGPDGFLDPDHSGEPGQQLRRIATPNGTVAANLSKNLADHTPDIVLLRAGTNDFNGSETTFFGSQLPGIVQNITSVVNQFFAVAGNDANHLIISTVPPNLRFATEQLSSFVNQGYSTVDGVRVASDAGNGTYQPGIVATVQALQANHPTLHIYDAPFDVSDLGDDDIHLTDAGYAAYAAGLQALIETEIGLTNGTIDGTAQVLGVGDDLEGGDAGDLIIGSAAANIIQGGGGNDAIRAAAGDDQIFGEDGNDRLEGEAGVDQATGGGGADTFIFGAGFADGHSVGDMDRVLDFGVGADRLALDASFEGEITVTNDAEGGVILAVGDGVGGLIGTIAVEGGGASSLRGVDLGGGEFDLAEDDALISFFVDTDYLLG